MEPEELFYVHEIFNKTYSFLLTIWREHILWDSHQDKDVGSHTEKENLSQTYENKM
jgi:hypothetical protein